MQRRSFIKSSLLFAAAASLSSQRGLAAMAGDRQARKIGPFDFARLKGRALALSEKKYQPPPTSLAKSLLDVDYDGYQAIRFRRERSLWLDQPSHFRIQFFHRGKMFREPVRMYEVIDGQTQTIDYNPAFFDLCKSGLEGAALPHDLGFAGFRIQFHTDWKTDVAAFLGASYFRAVGLDFRQYGLSARALAIDTGLDHAEEFPRFSEFYFLRPAKDEGRLTFFALLDSPSVTGAYRFDVTPGATLVMDVDSSIRANPSDV
jgi:glucans biosynthesis protein